MTTIQLSILTYNTHLYGQAIKNSTWAGALVTLLGIKKVEQLFYLDQERTQGIVNHINSCGADIVGLVEVWDNVLATDITNAVKDVYKFSYRPDGKISIQDQKFIGTGLLLLSKHQLSDQQFYNFNNLTSEDKYSCKGILTAKAELPNPSPGGNPIGVRLFLTHTQADEKHKDIRLTNISQLVDTVADYQIGRPNLGPIQRKIPVFVFGDFNVIAEGSDGQPTQEFQEIKNTDYLFPKVELTDYYRDLHVDVKEYPGYTYYYNQETKRNTLIPRFAEEDAKNSVHQRLDYIFYSQKDSSIKITPTEAKVFTDYTLTDGNSIIDLSDHYPILGKFDLQI
jgi:hypothetical protein